jgi:ubiquinone/menaquinone biosynthesis C-methylase UbiE
MKRVPKPKTEEQISYLWKDYFSFVKNFFQNTHIEMHSKGADKDNHIRHDVDPEYVENMILPISQYPDYWKGKVALDFGCGCGRNIRNLLKAADFSRVDGCDISSYNAEYSKKYIEEYFDLQENHNKCKTWETNGYSLRPSPDNEYDYVMSHVVFQHISNYSVRYNIIKDIYRVLKTDGIANLHFMDLGASVPYYHNYPSPGSTGEYGLLNCRVENSSYLERDFHEIGFKNIKCFVGVDPYANKKSYYIQGVK